MENFKVTKKDQHRTESPMGPTTHESGPYRKSDVAGNIDIGNLLKRQKQQDSPAAKFPQESKPTNLVASG